MTTLPRLGLIISSTMEKPTVTGVIYGYIFMKKSGTFIPEVFERAGVFISYSGYNNRKCTFQNFLGYKIIRSYFFNF